MLPPSNTVLEVLSDFAKQNGGALEPAEGTTDDPNIGVITTVGENTSVLYPSGLLEWDDVSQFPPYEAMRPVAHPPRVSPKPPGGSFTEKRLATM